MNERKDELLGMLSLAVIAAGLAALHWGGMFDLGFWCWAGVMVVLFVVLWGE